MVLSRSPQMTAVILAVAALLAGLAIAAPPAQAAGPTRLGTQPEIRLETEPEPRPVAVVVAGQLDENDLLTSTIPNDFYPENRDITDCISALPPPDCGSAARSGWPQFVVLGLLIVGVGTIAARVIISSRRARRAAASESADQRAASRSEQNATEPETS